MTLLGLFLVLGKNNKLKMLKESNLKAKISNPKNPF